MRLPRLSRLHPRRVLFLPGPASAAAVAMLATFAVLGAACTQESDSDTASSAPGGQQVSAGPGGYGAVIRRTSDGVPHIWAEDIKGVSFGQGWASAQDHPCDLVDQILKVTSRRAATFGAGDAEKNVQSDFGWAALGIAERASADWPKVKGSQRTVVESFAAGWNAEMKKAGAKGVTDWCAGQDWLRPITAEELYTYARSVTLLASGARLVDYIAKAKAPAGAAGTPTTEAALGAADGGGGDGGDAATVASNGWAIGSQRSASGKGMLLGNPHFPWIGELRFWEVQLTTADGMDVYGAQLLGLPGVGIGFTDGVAWTHTVSAGRRFTAYKMALAPGDPTSYLVDGQAKPMVRKDITIKVKAADGSTADQTRPYYATEFGPVLDFPGVGWTDTATTSYRDANIDNTRFLDQYLAMDRSHSLKDLQAAHRKFQGIPLFNTIATDADGTAWYADTSATPDLSPEALAAYQQRLETDGLTKIAAQANAVLLDGSTSRDRWVDDPEAPWPGVLPWSKLPQVQRKDYVLNANDSYWVPNASATIDGDYSILQGPKTARSVRTLENLAVLDDRTAGGPSGDDGKFTLDELTAAALRDAAYTEAQWRAGVVARCKAAAGPVTGKELTDKTGAVVVPAGPVDISRACGVLEAWDGRYDVASVGAVLWREFTRAVPPADMWATPFDKALPATTPAGLGPAQKDGVDLVLTGLATAVALLDKAGVALDAPLGQAQYDARVPQQRLPIPGGLGSEGVTNVVDNGRDSASTLQVQPDNPKPLTKDSPLTTGGYPVSYGTSFLMAVDYAKGAPAARTILTYGEVGNPTSPAFTAQSKDFAAKQWKTVRFTDADIAADKGGSTTKVSG